MKLAQFFVPSPYHVMGFYHRENRRAYAQADPPTGSCLLTFVDSIPSTQLDMAQPGLQMPSVVWCEVDDGVISQSQIVNGIEKLAWKMQTGCITRRTLWDVGDHTRPKSCTFLWESLQTGFSSQTTRFTLPGIMCECAHLLHFPPASPV